MIIPPFEVIAKWPRPNYVNPETRGESVAVLSGIFIALSVIFVALRLYVRLKLKKIFGWDDFFIILALVFSIAITVVFENGVRRFGWARHIWDIPATWIEGSYKNLYAENICFLLNSFFTISSLLVFYYRLGRNADVKWFKYGLYFAIAQQVITFPVFFFMTVFRCIPVKALWTFPPITDAKCLSEEAVIFGGGCVKLFMDLLLTTLPIPLIASLQMSRAQKYCVIMLIGLGYIVAIAGAVRTYYTGVIFWRTYDISWYEYNAVLASVVENNLAVICACAPTLEPLFPEAWLKSLRSRISRYLSHRTAGRTIHSLPSQTSEQEVKTPYMEQQEDMRPLVKPMTQSDSSMLIFQRH